MVDTQKIYDQFDAATAQVGAYAIFKGAEYVGRAVFKYPRDGSGRLYCYLQSWGAPMVRGYASGGGYDKQTAAFESAADQMTELAWVDSHSLDHIAQFTEAATGPDGERWSRRLEVRGYIVACVTE